MIRKYITACLWFLLLQAHIVMLAQNSDAPKSLGNTYFLQNCIVVKQPGVIIPNQNVIIKDGLIIDVGQGIKPPFDAQYVKTDTMYVYAGFIDAYSNTGVAKPEIKERQKVSDPGNPSFEVAGITPQMRSADTYKSSDKTVSDLRSAGFAISHVAPRGFMLPGSNNIFLLGEGNTDKMLLKANTGQTFQLETSRGVFPSTTIGIIAKFRDLYKNANIAGTHEELFKTNPAGLTRPEYSKELMAMYPVTVKKMPVYFVAQRSKDIHKALTLKNELGFDMVLTEVKQGWHYLDKIKKNNIGVLLSLELPEDDKKDGKSENKKDSIAVKDIKKIEKKEANPEKDNFDAKKEAATKEYLAQAALFEKNGIKFGFSCLNAKPGDIKKSIKRLIENGLSEHGALAALTTNPAMILGISNLAGTVEKGKIANLVITDKSYFDEKSSIKYVFVDGKKFDYLEKSKKETKPSESGAFVGVWSYVIETPGEKQNGKLTITKNEGEYKLTVKHDSPPLEETQASDIKVRENNISFYINTVMGAPVKIDFELKFESNKFSGNVSVQQFGTFSIKGELENEPKEF
jgi:imidazolonepropionase-like amidohydrolase